MKLVQGSVRGGAGRPGRGGGGRHATSDRRFAARFTDPRFQLSHRVQRTRQAHRRHTPHEQLATAVRRDPRFATRAAARASVADDDDEEDDEDEDEEEEEEEERDEEVEGDEEDGDVEHHSDDDADVAAWAPEAVEYTTPQRRLAVVNCDWDHVRAVDLYAILFHALPLGGQLHDVCIYLSDFGKRMLEHERVHGPDLWSKDTTHNASQQQQQQQAQPPQQQQQQQQPGAAAADDADDDERRGSNGGDEDDGDGGVASDGWVDDNVAMLDEQGDDGEYFSAGKYRKYEMNRLRYYYAIATFDSPETAAAVYAELDGMDIEASGVVLDLQYVEDAETFGRPVGRADHMPANFTPLAAFKAAALTQSRFRISWDQEDAFRHASVQDSFTGTTAEDDLAAYLAPPDSSSSSSSSEEDENEEDDEDGGEGTPGTRAVEDSDVGRLTARRVSRATKLKMRRRYAALLSEIGAAPDELDDDDDDDDDKKEKEEKKETKKKGGSGNHRGVADDDDDGDDGETHSGAERHDGDGDGDGDSDSDDNDDELNRFSDVELMDSEDSDGHRAAALHGEGGVSATLDLDTDNKAVQLQREARLRHQAKHGSLAAQAELKYKLRRKEAKKAKKSALLAERATQRSAAETESVAVRQQLQALMGTDTADGTAPVRLGGKERRKQHAREVKARLASKRAEMRQRRVARQMGVTPVLHKQQAQHAAAQALHSIDERFQAQLLHDARYHIDVARKDRRIEDSVAQLAGAVATVRHGMRQASTSHYANGASPPPANVADATTRKRAAADGGNGVRAMPSHKTEASTAANAASTHKEDDEDVQQAVNYFLTKKQGSSVGARSNAKKQ